MDSFSFEIITAPKENRYKRTKFFFNKATGELKVSVHKDTTPVGKNWVEISKEAYLKVEE